MRNNVCFITECYALIYYIEFVLYVRLIMEITDMCGKSGEWLSKKTVSEVFINLIFPVVMEHKGFFFAQVNKWGSG